MRVVAGAVGGHHDRHPLRHAYTQVDNTVGAVYLQHGPADEGNGSVIIGGAVTLLWQVFASEGLLPVG